MSQDPINAPLITKPTPGGNEKTWGNVINVNYDNQELFYADIESAINFILDNMAITRDELQDLLDEGELLIVTLDAKIVEGNILLSALNNSISTGDQLKTGLDTSIDTGTQLKIGLDASITTGDQLEADLDASIVEGNQLKDDIDAQIAGGDLIQKGAGFDNGTYPFLKNVTDAIEAVANSVLYHNFTSDMIADLALVLNQLVRIGTATYKVSTDTSGIPLDNGLYGILQGTMEFSTVAILEASDYLVSGDVIDVLWYYNIFDGGGHRRMIETSNNGSGILLANGLYANLIGNGVVDIKWFGASGGVDDSDAIQNTINYSDTTYASNGIYNISKPLYMSSTKKLKGESRIETMIKKTTNTVGIGGNLGKGGFQTYAVDAIVILTHLDNAYTTYADISEITLDSFADNDYCIYAPQVHVSIFKNLKLLVRGGLKAYYTFDTFMSSFTDINATKDNIERVGSIGIHFDSQSEAFETGTSCTFTNVWCHDGFEIPFRLERLIYSNLTSCGGDKFTKYAYYLNKSRIVMSGCGAEQSPTAESVLYSRYSLLEISQITAYTVDASSYLIDIQGGVVNINGFIHTGTPTGSTALRVADQAVVTVAGLSYQGYTTESVVDANSTLITKKNDGMSVSTKLEADIGTATCSIETLFGTSGYINSSGALYLGAGGLSAYITPVQISPNDDNISSGGSPTRRYTQLYAASGTINTSDEREKTVLEDLNEIEKRVALILKSEIKKFKFIDAINRKGEEARIHFGVGAQTVKRIFEENGLNPFDYALLCYDEWEENKNEGINQEAGNRYGIRYDELAMFILSSI